MTQAWNLSQLANKVNTSGQLDAATGLSGIAPVANGGTGVSTIAANGVVIGNGTGAITTVAPSTSGNVLTSNGTTWTSAAGSAYAGPGMQIFYTSGPFTVPTGITSFRVTCVGGGGGGAAGSQVTVILTTQLSGGSGGNGGRGTALCTGVSGTITVTVGTGGTGSNTGNGTAGTTSSAVGTGCSITSTGGGGGTAASPAGSGAGGASGSCTVATGTAISLTVPDISYNGTTSNTVTTPQTASLIYTGGVLGQGEQGTSANNAAGGVGGIVIFQW